MAVIADVYDEMTSFEWLERAYRKARKQKRYRREVLLFTSDLDANLLHIQEQMRDFTFRFGPYRRHWVYVPKKRLVMGLPFDGRIVHWAVYLVISPFFDRLMIEDSYACRENKGSLAAILRLQYWLQQIRYKPGDWYYVKIDISKYFYRIDHEVMLDILSVRIADERLMRLMDIIVNCDDEKFGIPRYMSPEEIEEDEWLSDVGVPIGNLPSQIFANIYLNELDQYCKHVLKIRRYIRYMDDIIVLAPSKELANQYKAAIEAFLRERLHLDLNKKTAIRPVDRPIEFVGYFATADRLKLRKKTVRRIKYAFASICRQYFSGEMTQEAFERRVASYRGMIAHCDNTNLRNRLNDIYRRERRARDINNLETIEALCALVELQNRIIQAQATRLSELDATIMAEQIAAANERCRELVGPMSEQPPAAVVRKYQTPDDRQTENVEYRKRGGA